jgi:bifunctional non-homologous end joining protein LigD
MLGPEVMLASSSTLSPDELLTRLIREGWFWEIKFDGIRAVVHRSSEGVRITNRRRADITHRYPDVVTQVETATPFTGMADGEIISVDANGRPDFSQAHLRDAQSSQRGVRAAMASAPATFMPFDALMRDGVDLRPLPYVERREYLFGMGFDPRTVSPASQDGATLWAFVRERGLEGLIAKRPDAPYRPGRQKSWVKLKLTHRLTAVVCGVVPGRGSRGPIGALSMCLWNPATKALVNIGRVGSGLSEAQLRDIQDRLIGSDPIVIEVEYLEVSGNGQLRMPIFKQVRPEVSPEACTLDQLG